MAEKLDPRQVVTFEELLRAMMFEQEATRREAKEAGGARIVGKATTGETAWRCGPAAIRAPVPGGLKTR